MARILSSDQSPLTYPGSGKRILRRPDFRGVLNPRLSGAPLTESEVDYDDLIIHRTYRSYDPNSPGEVRYLMYELSQKNPGENLYTYFFKAVRLARVTRVPRYLRLSSGTGPNMIFEQQRDVLSALREKQVLFLNVIAKSATLPMIFAYGVQGVGASPEEAQMAADEGWAVLTGQLDGVFQQLEYRQLTLEQGEALVRYQSEWNHIAMARGRPIAAGGGYGAANLLDGNRTDVESTLNQLESFLRGMSDREFILSLVTVPLSPQEMTLAWRNISTKLSQVRSEQQGQRSLTAGVAIPLSMGQTLGHTTGDGNMAASSAGVGQSAGTSHALTDTQGSALSSGITDTHTQGQSLGLTHTVGVGDTVGQNTSLANSSTHSIGTNHSLTDTASKGVSSGQNWGSSVGQSLSATTGSSQGISASGTSSIGQSLSAGASDGSSFANSLSNSLGSSLHGGIPGVLGGGSSAGNAWGQTTGQNASNSVGASLSGSESQTAGISQGASSSLGQGVNWGNTAGASIGTNQSIGNSLSSGYNDGIAAGLTLGHGVNQATSQSTSDAASTTASASVSQAQSLSQTASASQAVAAGSSQGTNASQGLTDGYTTSFGQSAAATAAIGVVPSVGLSISKAVFDEAKRMLGDTLEAQMRRYLEGIEGGAFLYQMFLTCPDRDTLLGASGLLKSAFWGSGTHDQRLPQPFHTITDFSDPAEEQRLLLHGQAFTSYRKREPSIELVEPFMFSSYITLTEAAAFCHPPTNENMGIMGVIDSMPILPMPMDRQNRDLSLGRVVQGERARISDVTFGIDVDEITHTLIAGTTGIGKTTTLMTMLAEISRVERTIVTRPTPANPMPESRRVRAGILGLDWMSNMRDLGSIVDPERFSFYSIAKPELGEFRWNPLAIPDDGMDPVEWASDMADNMTISFNLGEFGRSIIAELIADLYSANRLVPYALRPEVIDPNTGAVVRQGVYLPAVDPSTLPTGAILVGVDGEQVASVLTCPALSRLISMADLATLVLAKVEEAATVEGARLHGPAFRDRIQSLWRRVQYFAPGSMFATVFACDDRLDVRSTLSVSDLIDPEIGKVTIIEADGLDLTNRRFILGSVLLAAWRYGQFKGPGCFDQDGQGPGTFICLEEAHELFGDQGRDEDAFSAATRTSLYESMFRRARALGMKLIAVVQNCGSIPAAVTSNTTTVFIHRQYDDEDRKRAFSLLNWDHSIGQQLREWRYLGEMPRGYVIVRLDAKESYLESAPVQMRTDPAALAPVGDADLIAMAQASGRGPRH